MSQLLAQIKPEKLIEMALVDIAFEILKETKRPYIFHELMEEIVSLRKLSKEQKMGMIAQVYTEVNIDGRFVCLGESKWGLKRWYPTETVEESQEGGVKKKKVVLGDDFDDDFEIEDELVEELEEDEVIVFGVDEEFEEAEIEEDLEEEEEELAVEEELFEEDEGLVAEEAEEEVSDDNEDL